MFKTNSAPVTRSIFVKLIIAVGIFMLVLNLVVHWSDFMHGYRDGYAWAGSHTGQK